MILQLKRIFKGEIYTIGHLYIDGKYFCDTLEDQVRELPAYCPNTPKGLIANVRKRFIQKQLSRLESIRLLWNTHQDSSVSCQDCMMCRNFLGILIHSGNTATDSAGCIIVGKNKEKGKVLESRATSDTLNEILKKEREITIYIS